LNDVKVITWFVESRPAAGNAADAVPQ
jgi:hypothetical protein